MQLTASKKFIGVAAGMTFRLGVLVSDSWFAAVPG